MILCDGSRSRILELVVFIALFAIYGLFAIAETDDSPEEAIRLASDPALSPDGSTLVFAWRRDIWTVPVDGGAARQLTQHPANDGQPHFSPDGKEIAFFSDRDRGRQIYVMPVQGGTPERLTFHTSGYYLEDWFPDGQSLLVSGNRDHFWTGSQRHFSIQRHGRSAEKLIFDAYGGYGKLSPDGRRMLFTREGTSWWRKGYRGPNASQIWMYDFETGNFTKVREHENGCRYPLWKPDGSGFYYVGAQSGSFNLWEHDLESGAEVQLTRFEDDSVVFSCISRDGSTIVFRHLFDFYRYHPGINAVPRRIEIWNTGDQITPKMERRSTGNANQVAFTSDGLEVALISGGDLWVMDTELREPKQITATAEQEGNPVFSPENDAIIFVSDEDKKEEEEKKKLPEVVIDFDGIHERLKRVSIPNTSEGGLFWSHDSKKLAFTANIDGKRGTYTIEIPEELKPKLLSTKTGSQARWIKQDNQIVWLSSGTPGSLSAKGEAKEYKFSVKQEVDLQARNRAGFNLAWRTMRDRYYDERLGNRDWDAIRQKYMEMATKAVDKDTFGTVVNLMLGELNGSHLGFYPGGSGSPSRDQWSVTTLHLGVRSEPDYEGPGLKVRDVLPKGPADRAKSRIEPGMALTTVLNGVTDQDLHLSVRNAEDEDREVILRPISYGSARGLLYEKWLRGNRSAVEKASDGKLGYLHVRGMNWSSFLKFEKELYSAGAGKDGLVIDVRYNGGGSTTDYLLTALTQPNHAITVGRGGGPGYPQDRKVYATWHKPIVVLCNQNSFSNAEIFSHAIKTLKRGQLVGVPTAGGVISTGGASIMDLGFIRIPLRGWFLINDGEDMELNGAVPDHVLWPEPGQMPQGKDIQLEKAIQVLLEDVKKWNERERPALRKASERDK